MVNSYTEFKSDTLFTTFLCVQKLKSGIEYTHNLDGIDPFNRLKEFISYDSNKKRA